MVNLRMALLMSDITFNILECVPPSDDVKPETRLTTDALRK